MQRWILMLCAPLLLFFGGCASSHPRGPGTMLAIGGALKDDNAPVYTRFAALASRHGPPCIIVATAASADEDAAARGKVESLARWCGGAPVEVLKRGTPEAAGVAMIDRATAMFFTGGDQKRVTDRYLAHGTDSAEALAMRRLLARGGVIAGTSAGDAMMSRTMFLTGGSAAALGIRTNARANDESDGPASGILGPQIGPGMDFVPWVILDSHFFERDRVGRLVAALEVSQTPLGLGVGEDACVEIDLARATATGVSVAGALLVDASGVLREGLSRHGLRARLIRQGDVVPLQPLHAASARPASVVPLTVERGSERKASWSLFVRAAGAEGLALRLTLDGWMITAWASGDGQVTFDIDPTP